MPRNIFCVPGCQVVAEDGVPHHYFPCPEKDAERFHNWIKIIGGGIVSLDNTCKTHRICRQHFQKEFLYPKNRLCKLAVPSLLLPSAGVSESGCLPEESVDTAHLIMLFNNLFDSN
ncbi:unnamed protein product [Parnassius mnemosyne]|uniref:THAP-type domain-containing protein n=1 Tax=Parnassius mnemosyne TaxID=213953 RepID=A0AAV1L271_9NEOP